MNGKIGSTMSIEDPAVLLSSTTAETYQSRMDELFNDLENPKPDRKPASPIPPIFTATIQFSYNSTNRKHGLVLTARSSLLNMIIYDSSKKVIFCHPVNNIKFEFDEVKRIVEVGDDNMLITFQSQLDFLKFSILVLNSHQQSHFILSCIENQRITEGSSVLYESTQHVINGSGTIEESILQQSTKCKLYEYHPIQSLFIGLTKSSRLLVKSNNSILEITIKKVKINEDDRSSSSKPNHDSQSSSADEVKEVHAEIQQNTEDIQKDRVDSPKLENPQSNLSDDLYETLHRVVGIELDRIENRLTAKFDAFRYEVLTRLDKQNELLNNLLKSKDMS